MRTICFTRAAKLLSASQLMSSFISENGKLLRYGYMYFNSGICILSPAVTFTHILVYATASRPRGYKLEYSLKLKIKRNDWLPADTCPQAANHCALF